MNWLTQNLASQESYVQIAYLRKYPCNLIDGGDLEGYYEILTDFNFISDKINHPEFGVQTLIDDYDLVDEPEVSNDSEYNSSKVKTLKLIQDALRLSAHILNKDKTQLAGQLLIRLQYFKLSEIQAILKQAKQSQAISWLRPLSPSLTPPGGRLLRTLTGHKGAVLAVTVTLNGKYLISASKDNTIKVWNFQTGEEFFTLSGHSDWVLTLAVTPDSKQVISGSKDKTLKIWSLETGKEIDTLKGHTRAINALAVTPNGKKLISASDDSTFRVWDLENKKEVFNSYNHGYYITALAITPDGEQVIFAVSNTKIIFWSLLHAKKLLTLNGHGDTVSSLAVTPDGKQLISGSWDKTLKVWNLETKRFVLRRLLFFLKGHSNRITAVVITPDSKKIISDSLDNTLKVWDLQTGKELFHLKEHNNEINPLAVTPDGRCLISGSEKNTIKLWTLEENVDDKFTPVSHRNKVNALAITPNNKHLVSSSEDDTLIVWNLKTGEKLFTLTGNELSIAQKNLLTIENVDDLILLLDALDELPAFKGNLEDCFTIDGLSKLVNTLSKSTFKVWNLKTGKIDFMNYRDRVIAIVINPKYRYLAYKSWQDYSVENIKPEYNLEVWNLSNNKHFLLKNYDGGENPAIITPEGNCLISRSKSNFLTGWNLENGNIIFTLLGRIPIIKTLVITQDSQLIIAGLANKTIKVWNLKNKENIFTFIGHTDFVTAIAVTPDGKKLISGSSDKTIKIWDLEQGKEIITIEDEYYDSKITITLDGKWIFSESISDDFPILKVWDISTGEEVFTLTRYNENKNTLKVYNSSIGRIIAHFSIEDELECCSLAPDGVTIVAGDASGIVHFFRLEGFPPDIEQRLQEKSAYFVGREFVFTAINNFFNCYDRGYFTIVGAPGSGKSDIIIKYKMENPDVFYYNVQVKGKNSAEEFLKTINPQVETTNDASLQVILQHISQQLEANQRFIIAIDSLDAIDYASQAIGSNLFYLPRYLPKGIYFLLARRPFLKEKSGLLIEAPFQLLDLKDYPEENHQDIQTYIQQNLQEFLSSPSASEERLGVSKGELIRYLSSRSENNFMFIKQIITAIKIGFYSEKPVLRDILDEIILDAILLPYDLELYYKQHLLKMFASEETEKVNSISQNVLNILLRYSSPVSVKEISQIIDVDEYDVEEVLESWIEFLTLYQIDGETRYSLYHSSFRNWLIKVKT